MKNLIIIVLLFASASAGAQKWKIKKQDLALAGTRFAAGNAHGVREQVLYHPNEIRRDHPNWNPQWWDSRISWMNKYDKPWWKPVSLTDANHFFRSLENFFNVASICVSFGEKFSFWLIVKKLVIGYVSERAGFFTSYTLFFKNK